MGKINAQRQADLYAEAMREKQLAGDPVPLRQMFGREPGSMPSSSEPGRPEAGRPASEAPRARTVLRPRLDGEDRPPLNVRFATFHADNPHVYEQLVQLARRATGRGARRIGMKQLFEVLRWRAMLATSDPDGFKLNNDYTAPYARLIMETEKDLAGIFETRRSVADEVSE